MSDDSELLRRYVEERSESAFAELVQRKAGLVYSAALRQVGGDSLVAEDVAQSVFIDLARKARSLAGRPVLVSWLFTSTRFAALKALREKQRRQAREQEAQNMQNLESEIFGQVDWEKLRPLLDDAIHALPQRDRDVVLMRYFEGRSFAAMGDALGIGESSARMRTERAMDKLRGTLGRKGITSTAAALALVISTQAVAAPPVALTATLTGAALAQAAVGSGAGLFVKLYQLVAVKKIYSGVGALLAVLVAGAATQEVDENARLVAFLIYATCFGAGLLFALLTAIFGHIAGGQVDVAHTDIDHGGGTHGHAEGGEGAHDMPGFSAVGPTTIATFVTAFGGLGMMLTQLPSLHRFSAFLAAAGGLAIASLVGWGFSFIFRFTQSSSEGRVAALVGRMATVITPIPPRGVGEISYVQGGSRYSAPARVESGDLVPGGATVRIVRIVGNQFYVNSSSTHLP